MKGQSRHRHRAVLLGHRRARGGARP